MVTFNNEGFCIEIKTKADPIDAWLETHDQLVDMLDSEDTDMHIHRSRYLELLRSMMPDKHTARRMLVNEE